MDYSKQVQKLKNQLRYWRLMIIFGGIIGVVLTFVAMAIVSQAVLAENDELVALGSLISMLSGFPIDVAVAGIILTFIWKRRIANYESHMETYHNNEFQDYHDYSIPEEDKIKNDPLSEYTNKDDPYH